MSPQMGQRRRGFWPQARYGILALIAVATALNYLDRSLLSIAAPSMAKEMQLSPAALGIVFSAFSWSYAVAQVPGGVLLDKLGTRHTYFWSITLWSVFTALQGAVFNLWTLLAARLGLGVAEAPCYPANSRVLITWFPRRERARANSVYAVGQYFGVAFLSPLLFWITAVFGWRMLFFVVGILGIVYGLVWRSQFREAGEHPDITDEELALIEEDGGHIRDVRGLSFSWRNVGWLLSQRQILGASLGQFAQNSTLVFFLTWFPTYLVSERGMTFLSAGFYTVLPFIAAAIGALVGGQLSDFLVRRTGSLSLGRKLPVITGLLLATTIVAAAFLESDTLVIAIMSLAFFGQGMSNLGWTLLSEVAPSRLIGLTGGVFNFCTQLAGIITPIVVGSVVQLTGSFYGALAFIGSLTLLGAFSYIFIIGDVERIGPPPWADETR